MGYASQCIQCGQCLDKCPQGIAIPDMLEQAVSDLEDDKTLEDFQHICLFAHRRIQTIPISGVPVPRQPCFCYY